MVSNLSDVLCIFVFAVYFVLETAQQLGRVHISSMSNIGSTSGQQGDNITPPQISRKRGSHNSGSSKSEASATTSVSAVGSSSSKLRRVTHSSAEQVFCLTRLPLCLSHANKRRMPSLQNPEGSELTRQQTSHSSGTFETAVSGGGGRRTGSSSNRSGHESSRSELRYLTDFFPDQSPGNRRLTRSQRQYSVTGSSNHTADNIDHSTINSSAPLEEHQRGPRDRPRGRRGRTSVGTRVAAGAGGSRATSNSDQQPSTSARTRAHGSATGVCHSITRCEGTGNRIPPTYTQQREPSAHRSVSQLIVIIHLQYAILLQEAGNDASSSTVNVGSNLTLTASINASEITAAGVEGVRTANNLTVIESHTSQLRNLQRSVSCNYYFYEYSQAVHAASTFLGALVPRVQHLLGTAHAHPSKYCFNLTFFFFISLILSIDFLNIFSFICGFGAIFMDRKLYLDPGSIPGVVPNVPAGQGQYQYLWSLPEQERYQYMMSMMPTQQLYNVFMGASNAAHGEMSGARNWGDSWQSAGRGFSPGYSFPQIVSAGSVNSSKLAALLVRMQYPLLLDLSKHVENLGLVNRLTRLGPVNRFQNMWMRNPAYRFFQATGVDSRASNQGYGNVQFLNHPPPSFFRATGPRPPRGFNPSHAGHIGQHHHQIHPQRKCMFL
ncbi:unnamed protein product [Thelazia callipaeda]|uniref:RING-type domain-containing protein n=1 Tax=Thelazia callipaeda TaxID=103827 RepID=A0A158RCT7_THECL|nr:unnamed protein product [Thelazia callipaeda]